MRIYYTKHAKERMTLRKITEAMLKASLIDPDEIAYGYFGRSIVFKKFIQGVIKVVFIKEKNKQIIISVIWHSRNKKL
ncbi:hypothetical protein A3A09_02255 [Candidatus Nomurabacteria bacterium RIFCSPLOWO2_01_FULL_42_20]|uniref:DUF4258 domain-containing protein n=1 Tax=Candidatus Nomurabacteria bacterium RIFCSPHIGHO2_01_FULL_42_16 TaxID=1801743 RepID=A0A1F6VHP0_9BACT|nr:MAG: hypothetical protein A2824_01975 [Candidatus Nomurabacteria bacterium RIFCSPHIGHO2_01_FULL_42_16]OGI92103.1 MAG: hypothetical protein A3A09_02255 [Candidatus Nomurabacteria bacterium RIFCSPLOWO2_01_FULL_42_20]